MLTAIALLLALRLRPAPADARVVLRWDTATGLDTAGFNVYRAEERNGALTRANDALIPASPDPLVGGDYLYEDRDVVAGRSYYYTLEVVETNGQSSRQPPVEVTAEGSDRTPWLAAMAVAVVGLAAMLLLAMQPGRLLNHRDTETQRI